IERHQPYRGGQIVPLPEDVTQPLFIYGSSEQARPSRNDGGSLRYTSIIEGPNLQNRLGETEPPPPPPDPDNPPPPQAPLGFPTVGQFERRGAGGDDQTGTPDIGWDDGLRQTIGSHNSSVADLSTTDDPDREAWDYLV